MVKNNSTPKRITKSDLTREKILKAAVVCLARDGDRATSFQSIADEAGVSQPLVIHYLKRRDHIFETVFGYLLSDARERTEAAIAKETKWNLKLRAYLNISYEIFRKNAETARIYLMFYQLSSVDPRLAVIHEQLRTVARDRIRRILRGRPASKASGMSGKDEAALIHASLTGVLLEFASSLGNHRPDQERRRIVQLGDWLEKVL